MRHGQRLLIKALDMGPCLEHRQGPDAGRHARWKRQPLLLQLHAQPDLLHIYPWDSILNMQGLLKFDCKPGVMQMVHAPDLAAAAAAAAAAVNTHRFTFNNR